MKYIDVLNNPHRNEYTQNCYFTMTVIDLELNIAPRTLVTITIVIIILELALVLKLLVIITIVIVKDVNYLKFTASYSGDTLLHTLHQNIKIVFVAITIVIVILELDLILELLIIMTMVIMKNSNYLKFKAKYIKKGLPFNYYHDNSEMQGLSCVLICILTIVLTNELQIAIITQRQYKILVLTY